MKGFLKKMTAFFTAFAMILTIAGFQPMDAKAAESDITGGSITLQGVEEADSTITAYRIMEVKLDDHKNLTYKWADNVQTWVDANYAEYSDPTAFTGLSDSVARAFYDALALKISDGTVSVTPKTATAGGTSTDVISELNAGLYLVLAKGKEKVYKPMTAAVLPGTAADGIGYAATIAETTNVTAKSEDIIVDKTQTNTADTENGVNIGDTVSWSTTYGIPEYPAETTNPEYYVYDILPKSLAIKADSIKVYGVKAGAADALLASPTAYSEAPTVPEVTAPADGQTWAFKYSFVYAQIKDYDTIKVTYDTTVTAEAEPKAMGVNKAGVTYEKPFGDGTGTKDYGQGDDDEIVPETYGANVNKKDKTTQAMLAGAVFSVTADGETDPIKFVKVSDGVYRKALDTDAAATTVTELVVGKDTQTGKLTIKGVKAGAYSLTEITAPAGYSKLTTPVTLTIAKDTATGYTDLDVPNAKFLLPSTGGMGTILFSVLGILLMAAGFVMFQRSKKNRA